MTSIPGEGCSFFFFPLPFPSLQLHSATGTRVFLMLLFLLTSLDAGVLKLTVVAERTQHAGLFLGTASDFDLWAVADGALHAAAVTAVRAKISVLGDKPIGHVEVVHYKFEQSRLARVGCRFDLPCNL